MTSFTEDKSQILNSLKSFVLNVEQEGLHAQSAELFDPIQHSIEFILGRNTPDANGIADHAWYLLYRLKKGNIISKTVLLDLKTLKNDIESYDWP